MSKTVEVNGELLFPSVIWEQYRNGELSEDFNLCPIAPQFGLPRSARLLTHTVIDKYFASPYIASLGDMSARALEHEIRYAENMISRRSRKYSRVTFKDEDEIWGVIRDINRNAEKLTAPHTRDYLEEFEVVIAKRGTTVAFRPSRISPLVVESVSEVIPYVDAMITNRNGERIYFCLGISSLRWKKLYQLACFWFKDYDEKAQKQILYHSSIYDLVQEMIEIMPERTVVVDPNGRPVDYDPDKKIRTAEKTPLIRTFKNGQTNPKECHPANYLCQEVRSYKRRDGKVVKGYRRGPERNNPAYWDECKHNYIPVTQE